MICDPTLPRVLTHLPYEFKYTHICMYSNMYTYLSIFYSLTPRNTIIKYVMLKHELIKKQNCIYVQEICQVAAIFEN